MTEFVYKICGKAAWQAAVEAGCYGGSQDDVRDGFIHLSTAAQLPGTANRHFAGRDGLMVAAFAVARLGEALRWEASREGQLFPHLYGKLIPKDAEWVRPMKRTGDGYDFAELGLGGSVT